MMSTSRVSKKVAIATLMLLAMPLLQGASCANLNTANSGEPPPVPKARTAYVIGPGDVLSIKVWQNEELSVTVPVRTDGMISVPLLDDVQAQGKTALELKETLTEGFKKYVRTPDVTVIVGQINSKRVSVVGQVASPQSIALQVDMRVVDAIAIVGGFSTFANQKNVKILRPEGGRVLTYRFNYKSYLKGENPENNILLEAGDTIVVSD